jgi:thiamine monophosphate kinase
MLGASFSQMVFHGGEEFELVAVIPREKWGMAVRKVEHARGSLTPIGRIISRKGVWYCREDGKTVRVLRRGWEHLK